MDLIFLRSCSINCNYFHGSTVGRYIIHSVVAVSIDSTVGVLVAIHLMMCSDNQIRRWERFPRDSRHPVWRLDCFGWALFPMQHKIFSTCHFPNRWNTRLILSATSIPIYLFCARMVVNCKFLFRMRSQMTPCY